MEETRVGDAKTSGVDELMLFRILIFFGNGSHMLLNQKLIDLGRRM
jgi:hypothetical protein